MSKLWDVVYEITVVAEGDNEVEAGNNSEEELQHQLRSGLSVADFYQREPMPLREAI